jgi:truncated hemoglobin YjbI
MSSILLPTYLGTPKFDEFIEKFYENVMLSDLVKHFFLLAKKPTVVRDLNRYWPYLIPKTLLEYRKPAVASSDYDIRLPESQFSEVVLIMAKLLREMKFNVDHAPQLMHEILELVEETRSQASASTQSVIEGKDINSDILQVVLKRNKIQSEVMPSKAIKTGNGLEHEVWIRFDHDEDLIGVSGKIHIKDESFDDQLTEIIEKQAEKESIVQLKLVRDAGPQHFLASHSLPLKNGIPIRLFIKYLQKFAVDLFAVYALDKNSVLKKKT